MIERKAIDQVKRVLIEEAQTDTVGLWAVLWQVKQEIPLLTPDEARQATLTAIREALGEEHVIPGEFMDQDENTAAFVVWQLSVDEVVARIEREWAALGREPNLGEVVWLVDPHLLPLTARKHPMGKDWKPRSKP
jgi:hypothetical protein